MSNVNIRLKHIFIHIPKTGGRSMCSVPWNRADIYNLYGHYTIKDIQDYGIDISKYYKWCFVRNPWERILSGYDFSEIFKKKYINFEKFVNEVYTYKDCYVRKNLKWSQYNPGGIPDTDIHFPHIFLYNQVSLITIDDTIVMDFIGRFENIHEDWKKICDIMKKQGFNKLIEESHYTLPKHHIRKDTRYSDRPYQEFYTKDMMEKVAEIYKDDIVAFNYKF